MIEVLIPNKCVAEVEYVFHCLFEEFLGVEYSITTDSKLLNYQVSVGGRHFIINNHFFDKDDVNLLYIAESIPSKVEQGKLVINGQPFDTICLFGSLTPIYKRGYIEVDNDIIASTFFMLSRWEEYANKERDMHNRFAATSSLAYKHEFLERPIVNEYVEILWQLLIEIGYEGKRKIKKFTMVPTHDVDKPYMWGENTNMFRSIGFSIFKKKDFRESLRKVKYAFLMKDPYDTHSRLMDLSEKIGVQSNFFFIAGGNSRHEQHYTISHPRIKKLINDIKDRGHEIGLHPSYNTYNDFERLQKEKLVLESIVGSQIVSGRQHYLRLEVPYTLQYWNDMGMEWDSTLSFADFAGFRCGVCYPFPVYNFLTRQKLQLIERPLITMEASLIGYEKLSNSDCISKQRRLKSEVQKYNGEFVFLWHNSSFNSDGYMYTDSILYDLYKT